MDISEVNYLAESMEIEMPRRRVEDILEDKVSNWDEHRALFTKNGIDLANLDSDSLSAIRALQLAAISDLIRIIPRKPFNIAIKVGFLLALGKSGAFANRAAFPWSVRLLRFAAFALTALAGYGAYSSRGWIAAVISAAVCWWIVSKPLKHKQQEIVTRAAIESNTAFNFLWSRQQYAIFDVVTSQTYDVRVCEDWTQVLAMLSGAVQNDLVSRESRWGKAVADIKTAKEAVNEGAL